MHDFNFPGINWSTPHDSGPTAAPLISLADSLFVNQQVNEPTCQENILDLIFGPDGLFKSITVTKSYISDHSIIWTETSLPICTKSSIEFNLATSEFDKLDFNKANWVDLRAALKPLCGTIEDEFLFTDPTDVIISKVFDTICHHCIAHVPHKTSKKVRISHFHRARKILMRKRRKLLNKPVPSNKIERRLTQIEHDICASHQNEKVHDENVAIAKIKSDPNYFFRYAKKN